MTDLKQPTDQITIAEYSSPSMGTLTLQAHLYDNLEDAKSAQRRHNYPPKDPHGAHLNKVMEVEIATYIRDYNDQPNYLKRGIHVANVIGYALVPTAMMEVL